jgi:uncharacterized membrane protein YdfJ with MMPL/SSD domain
MSFVLTEEESNQDERYLRSSSVAVLTTEGGCNAKDINEYDRLSFIWKRNESDVVVVIGHSRPDQEQSSASEKNKMTRHLRSNIISSLGSEVMTSW